MLMVWFPQQLVNLCYKKNDINPLLPWLQLIGGLFATLLSFSWFLQILLQIFLRGRMAFLNVIFTSLTDAFPLFGVCAYGVFAFYIMITVISGSIKFAGRFFLISIHPMKVNGTMMNSFLFNVGILLVCSVAAIQLCTTAFAQFANNSAISQIFVVQIQYLKGLNFFYSINVPVFYCILYIVSLAFLLYSLVCCMCCAAKQADNVNDAVAQLRREMRE
jgi:LMBR1 domain-containing protein 1